MEIRHLISFKAVVDYGGFSRAADNIGYTQSTITAHIQAIETELGAPLFDRLGKTNVLTDVGKRVLAHATTLIKLYDSIEEIATDKITGMITLGSTESLTLYWLLPIVYEYKQRHPQVNLSIKTADGDTLRTLLRRGEIDIAFLVEFQNEDYLDFTTKILSQEPMVLIVHPNHKLNGLENTDCILFTQKSCSFRALFEKYLSNNHIQTTSIFEFGSVEAIKYSVKNGLGVAMLPLFSVQNEIKQESLKILPFNENNTPTVTVLLAYHKDKWISPALESFIQLTDTRSSLNIY